MPIEESQQTQEAYADLFKALEEQKKIVQAQREELENAYKLLEEKRTELGASRKYKSEFLANMSHEFRTPLNSIIVFSKILCENKWSNLTPKQEEFADTIHVAGAELLKLIDTILDFSALEAEDITLHAEQMSLHGLAMYIEHTFRPAADQQNLALTITLSENVPASIRTDRQRVEQIVKNLLSNALKFTSEGDIHVNIARPPVGIEFLHTPLAPQQTIAISITDTGIGIPRDKLSVIFEAFRQADGELTRKYEGVGLGLSIARILAERLGGEIQVGSEEGKGSTFTLYLPEVLTTESKQKEIPGVSPLASLSGVEAIRDDRRDILPTDRALLIIEDDPKLAKLLFDRAHERKFKCLLAGDGEAGLLLADQYQLTAIILSPELPGMDGWKVMMRLKENLAIRHIPVYFISSQQKALDAIKMGAIGYQSKPITYEKIDDIFETIDASVCKTQRNVLFVQADKTTRHELFEFFRSKKIHITTATTIPEACQYLHSNTFDCLVLEGEATDISVTDLLKALERDKKTFSLPVILHFDRKTVHDLTLKLKPYEDRLVLKWATTQEQLLNEITLFLHCTEDELPQSLRKQLRTLYNKKAVLMGKTVLIVDDDMRNVFALSHIFEEYGMNVHIAENGQEALESLNHTSTIDLILLDIVLPDMSGYMVMKQIRNRQTLKEIPIIALSAKAKRGDRQRCITAGANEYLSKPVNTDKLFSLLRVWLY